ncbi:unnamed protein product [Symbiodinium natans]|uniref:Uncharacterized protein n=1 Tax=Symbiodinium natans TaxID=878477 RepID=A0A812J8X6_9DINO|nr:unnamed protein product [Symbiodinium natans]
MDKVATAESCRLQWAKARGHPVPDATRHSLAVSLAGHVLDLVDVALWEGPGSEDFVPLEFLFTGAPSCVDESEMASALTEKLEDRLQDGNAHGVGSSGVFTGLHALHEGSFSSGSNPEEEHRAEFRSQLKQRAALGE